MVMIARDQTEEYLKFFGKFQNKSNTPKRNGKGPKVMAREFDEDGDMILSEEEVDAYTSAIIESLYDYRL
jgi:hypothetical protein